jgi:hypothetical protein
MPALFPGSVRIFTPKVDLVDTVMASHVNLLQDEMTAVQSTLGAGLLSSSWSGSYSNPSTHASVAARLTNIESGVKANATTLASVSGSVVGTTSTQTLTNKTINAAQNTIVGLAALTGATFTGQVNVVSATAAGSSSTRQIVISTADPSGGADGDVWIKYIA